MSSKKERAKALSGISLSCEGPEGLAEFKILSSKLIPICQKTGKIYYHLFNHSPDMGEYEHLLMMEGLFRDFNYEMWPIQALPTKDPKKAYFKIYFINEEGVAVDGDGKVILKPQYQFRPSTLAIQYANYNSTRGRKNWSGHCFINDKFYFQLKDNPAVRGKDITKIIKHEVLGHGTGLHHTDVKGDLMEPIYDPDNKWGIDSMKGIDFLYGEMRAKLMEKLESPNLLYQRVAGSQGSPVKSSKNRTKRTVVRNSGGGGLR